jgi:hypothetical protein
MHCCVDCFTDPEIRGIIEAGNQTGSCDVCGSQNVFIYDLVADNNNNAVNPQKGFQQKCGRKISR